MLVGQIPGDIIRLQHLWTEHDLQPYCETQLDRIMFCIEKHSHTVLWNLSNKTVQCPGRTSDTKHLILHSTDDWCSLYIMLPYIACQRKELLSYALHCLDFNGSMKWITNAVSPLVYCMYVCFSLSCCSFFPKVIKCGESTGCEQRCQRWTLFAVGTRVTRGRLSLMSLE